MDEKIPAVFQNRKSGQVIFRFHAWRFNGSGQCKVSNEFSLYFFLFWNFLPMWFEPAVVQSKPQLLIISQSQLSHHALIALFAEWKENALPAAILVGLYCKNMPSMWNRMWRFHFWINIFNSLWFFIENDFFWLFFKPSSCAISCAVCLYSIRRLRAALRDAALHVQSCCGCGCALRCSINAA